MPTPKPITFRLYPEANSTLFCRVNVWTDRREMADHCRREHRGTAAGGSAAAAAVASGQEVYRVGAGGGLRKTGEFCVINCHRQEIDVEIVAHEVTHAAWRWRSRVGIPVERATDFDRPGDVSDNEERFCYALGRMVRCFVGHLRRRRIWGWCAA